MSGKSSVTQTVPGRLQEVIKSRSCLRDEKSSLLSVSCLETVAGIAPPRFVEALPYLRDAGLVRTCPRRTLCGRDMRYRLTTANNRGDLTVNSQSADVFQSRLHDRTELVALAGAAT